MGSENDQKLKNGVLFLPNFHFLPFLDPLAISLKFLYFLWIVEFIPNILVSYF